MAWVIVVCITTTAIVLSSHSFPQWQGSSAPRIPCIWDDLTVPTRFSWFLLLFCICLYAQFVCNNVPFHPWPWQVLCSLIHPDPAPLPCSQTAAESQALHWLWMQLGTLSSPPLLSWLSKPIADGLYLIHNKDFFFFWGGFLWMWEADSLASLDLCFYIFFLSEPWEICLP